MDDNMSNEAVLVALQQVGSAMASISQEMASNREVMTEMRLDMATIKERQTQHSEFKEFLKELKAEIEKVDLRLQAVETRNNKVDGAMGLAQWVREFGPWFLSMAAVAFAYITTRLHN
jgi:predicted  nucleic acid-binding Zn-ribbon protein